mmetsp:Transcript_89028/g.181510  ORF Transcript_89028/g.181510 Transcript_89028/m.181510 type:complete len:98 (+) Transcript_89028:668-961(+)
MPEISSQSKFSLSGILHWCCSVLHSQKQSDQDGPNKILKPPEAVTDARFNNCVFIRESSSSSPSPPPSINRMSCSDCGPGGNITIAVRSSWVGISRT